MAADDFCDLYWHCSGSWQRSANGASVHIGYIEVGSLVTKQSHSKMISPINQATNLSSVQQLQACQRLGRPGNSELHS
jgi:hypothetical protein